MQIFLIEDDEIYATYISKSLSLKPGRIVRHFSTGEAAWDSLSNNPPDALVIDFDLPGIKGIELFEKINKEFGKGKFRTIMLSSLDDGKIVLSFIRRGVRDYVIKDEHAVDALNAILEGREEEMLFY
jgi:DNA-binding NarL/FixJ family response regulator